MKEDEEEEEEIEAPKLALKSRALVSFLHAWGHGEVKEIEIELRIDRNCSALDCIIIA